MNNTNISEEISLRLLDELTKEPLITQRALSDRLGIALGLVNAYVKRLYKKGYIKIKNLPKNRIKYIITPKGFTEKARLTYNYMHRSVSYFKEIRCRIENTYVTMLSSGVKNILLWGDGEIAELCYISTRGLPLKIVGVVGDKRIENGFFGHHIYTIEDIKDIDYDAILIASIEDKVVSSIKQSGINPDRVYSL
ncbi:transcriptional regulator [Dissulfurispira thermophila]|uniref:Transcriptional regulator n=2 Tax=root TaxID=1 RepID=A0A7G1H0N0_9BACT|nr:winged helix-turn-helix transcriptional regulator [Dissulfurispira thermophila]BCB96350.1 transcriptional regulator [Dissulfurispira thermophila]